MPSATWAMPKSVTMARPRAVSMMFWGFRSRCTTPEAWGEGHGVERGLQRLDGQPRRHGAVGLGPVVQGAALDQVHDHVDALPFGADVVHRGDVRVSQPRHRRGLGLEPPPQLLLGGELRREQLDGPIDPQPCVVGPEHRGHPAFADDLQQLVAALREGGGVGKHRSSAGAGRRGADDSRLAAAHRHQRSPAPGSGRAAYSCIIAATCTQLSKPLCRPALSTGGISVPRAAIAPALLSKRSFTRNDTRERCVAPGSTMKVPKISETSMMRLNAHRRSTVALW